MADAASMRGTLEAAGRALRAVDLAASGDAVGRVAAARRFVALAAPLEGEGVVAALGSVATQAGPATAPALRLLAALGGEAATRQLLAATRHEASAVSQMALHALVNLRPSPDGAELLLAHWQDEGPEAIRSMLARALAQQQGPALRRWATDCLQAPSSARYVDPIVRGIAAGGDADVVAWADALRASSRPDLRLAAAGACLQLGQAAALDELLAAARGGTAALRKRALAWLVGAPFVAVEQVFVDALADPSAALREQALLALPFTCSATSIPRATALLADPKPAVVHQAQAVFWLLTGSPAPGDPALAARQAMRTAARLPAHARSLQGQPLQPSALAALLANPSYAAAAASALRMLAPPRPTQPEFRPDCDLIRNLDALLEWQAVADELDVRHDAGGRYYAGVPLA